MKRLPLLLSLVTFCLCSPAQGEKQLLSIVKELNRANTISALKKTYTSFEKYIETKPSQWQAYYYAGLNALLLSFEVNKSEADEYSKKADEHISKADSVSRNNSEIVVLKSMSAAARLKVDPKNRALKYGTASKKYADKAIELNADNPRAYLVRAKAALNTPENLGGGCKAALKYYEKAITKFNTTKNSAALDPSWGMEMAVKEKEQCDLKLKQSKNGK